jgi:hypothetical protein
MRFVPVLLATLASTLPGRAQEQVAAQLLAAQTAAAVGSDAWFDLGFERVEVELAYDVGEAVATARELLAAAAANISLVMLCPFRYRRSTHPLGSIQVLSGGRFCRDAAITRCISSQVMVPCPCDRTAAFIACRASSMARPFRMRSSNGC